MQQKLPQWLAPPHFEGDEEKSRAASLLNLILWIFILASLIYGIFAPIEPAMRLRRAGIILTFIAMMLVVKQIIHRGYIRPIGFLIVLALWMMFTAAMVFGADYTNPAFMGYVLVVISAGLVLSWRAAIGWSLLSIVTSVIILVLGERGTLPHSSPAHPFDFGLPRLATSLSLRS